jgi:hypothetical protein
MRFETPFQCVWLFLLHFSSIRRATTLEVALAGAMIRVHRQLQGLRPYGFAHARRKKNYMGPLFLLILLVLLCLIGFSFLAAKGAVPLKKSKPKEGRKRPTQALHDVIFGQNDE